MENIDRRNFLKLVGTLGITAIFSGSLMGCSDETQKNEDQENENLEQETAENGQWIKTGNKKIYKAYEHIIWKEDFGYSYCCETEGEIDVPEGYAYIKDELLYTTHKSHYICIVNTVDVEVEEYKSKNEKIKETSYPFAGTPLDLKKAEEMPKILVKEYMPNK